MPETRQEKVVSYQEGASNDCLTDPSPVGFLVTLSVKLHLGLIWFFDPRELVWKLGRVNKRWLMALVILWTPNTSHVRWVQIHLSCLNPSMSWISQSFGIAVSHRFPPPFLKEIRILESKKHRGGVWEILCLQISTQSRKLAQGPLLV